MLNRKIIMFPLVLLAVTGLFLSYNFFARDCSIGNQVALAASNSFDNLDLEYIKINTPDGYCEHWRDVKNLEERADTYDSKGNLVNKTIVKESGKRVISIGFENGEPEAYTWVLPDNIASINKGNLSKSLFKEIKEELKKPKWQDKGIVKLSDGGNVRKIQSSFEDTVEVVYIDGVTGFPVKREFYNKQNDQLKLVEERTEEYKKVSRDSEKIFDPVGVELKEVPAPVVNDSNATG